MATQKNKSDVGIPVHVFIRTDDIQLADIVRDYWDMDAENRFTHRASEISARYRALGYRSDFNEAIRLSARVVVNNLPCRSCGGEVEVTGRRALMQLARRPPTVGAADRDVDCTACELGQERDEAAEKAAKLEQLRANVEAYAGQAEHPDYWVDYSTLPFDVCMKLSAYDAWAGHALSRDGGPPYTEGFITPTHEGSRAALRTFHTDRGLIRPAPCQQDLSGFVMTEEGGLQWQWHAVRTVLVPHFSGSTNDALTIASARLPDTAEDGMAAWSECATEACMAYLYGLLKKDDFYLLDEGECEDVTRSLAVAVQHYSVAQVWSLIWKCVRDAEVLCARPYYSAAKAAATIPGKIDRAVQAARGSRRELPAYLRTGSNPACELEILFQTQFGINEKTTPAEARSIFAKFDPPASGSMERRFFPAEFDVAVRQILSEERYANMETEWDAVMDVGARDFVGVIPESLRSYVETVRHFACKWIKEARVENEPPSEGALIERHHPNAYR